MSNDAAALRGNWSYPTKIRFGVGRIAELPAACKELGFKRPLFVTDPGLAGLSMVQNALANLRAAGLPTALYSDIRSNPVAKNVEDGIKVFRDGKHDGVIRTESDTVNQITMPFQYGKLGWGGWIANIPQDDGVVPAS